MCSSTSRITPPGIAQDGSNCNTKLCTWVVLGGGRNIAGGKCECSQDWLVIARSRTGWLFPGPVLARYFLAQDWLMISWLRISRDVSRPVIGRADHVTRDVPLLHCSMLAVSISHVATLLVLRSNIRFADTPTLNSNGNSNRSVTPTGT